jgi:outer membrane protein assembly factor BamA
MTEQVTKKQDDGTQVTEEVSKEVINTALTPMYFRVNEEIRWTFPWKSLRAWQIVQFFDWARVVDTKDKSYEDAQEGSLGLGIRYRWQFLTFRLDYAIVTGITSYDEDKKNSMKFKWGRFAFDLSQAF